MPANSSQKHRCPSLGNLSLFLCFLLFISCLISCKKIPEYTADELLLQIQGSIPESQDWIAVGDRYLRSIFSVPIPEEVAYSCLRNNDTGMDEIGVFVSKSAAEAQSLSNALENELNRRALAFDDRYFSEEKTKFEHARVFTKDKYTVYAILSPDNINILEKHMNQLF